MKNPPAPVPEGHRHCFKCGVTKPFGDFYPSQRRGRASETHRVWCKVCTRAYYSTPEWKKWYIDHQRGKRAEKRAWALNQKVATGCADCGENHPACLDFHHRDPSKKLKDVVKIVDQNAGWKRIEAEAEKCEVLCSNCHRKRHYTEREALKVSA